MIHVMLDGYQGNETRLDDIKAVNSVLNQIVAAHGRPSGKQPNINTNKKETNKED